MLNCDREIMIFLITAGAWELLSGGCLQSWHCLCLGKGQHLMPKNDMMPKTHFKPFDAKKYFMPKKHLMPKNHLMPIRKVQMMHNCTCELQEMWMTWLLMTW